MNTPSTTKPQRAEPLQPDRPGRGDSKQPAEQPATQDDAAQRQRQQSEDAIDNTREGYG